jgi:kynurenine 3-monooxygenase
MSQVVVVGGGLVGCLLAVYLARRGHRVLVFERHEDPRADRISGVRRPSINLTLCERGLAALEAVGVRDQVLRLAVPALGRRIHAPDGHVTYQPYGNRGEAIQSISRRELNAALMDFASAEPNVSVHFQQKCVQVDFDRPSATFEDARTSETSEVEAECIFGADGAHSALRSHLQKTDRFDYSQQYWTQGYRELTMPPAGPMRWPLAEDSLHIWPRGGYMLIGFANHDHSFSCALHLPFEGENSHQSIRTEAGLMEFMRAAFPDAVGLIPNLAAEFFAARANSMLTVRSKPWHHGDEALLIGDAAHAILPSYGQGANAGFEDCLLLDGCLEKHKHDRRAAFQEYEASRRPSMDAMADLCIEHFAELRDRVADPAFLRQKAIERRLNELHPDLYEPLYSMISFTRRPYLDAVRVERRQQEVVARLLEMDRIEERVDTPEVRQMLEDAARGSDGGVAE